jgi:hypothetical protein
MRLKYQSEKKKLLKELGADGWIILKCIVGCCEQENEPLDSIKTFLDSKATLRFFRRTVMQEESFPGLFQEIIPTSA